ncbi:metal-dependent hydrolase [Vibrio sp. SM6]|uniref:Metal-dependent hydrolase n=1 Tax=Vibrio agarilyticus TaxID=2726741 RepID=A0A7X8TR35_9VIBR|nr:metal-dependent hydrolase [Vibrio agarilyticus]NLS13437.1 metal-dependent hydrolase [Vibrio agarilyticus]
MDSITQAALGATIAGAIAGKQCNGKVLLMGALLGTLPDLDVILDYGDAVSNTIKHRGFTHSLLLLPFLSLMLAWGFHRLRPSTFWTFKRVLLVTFSVLITHPLLDAMTTYGTQLLWPFHGYFELRNIFIIDPLYTVPLLIAPLIVLLARTTIARQRAAYWCQGALVLSTLYLVWGYAAQQYITQRVEQNLRAQALPHQQVLVMPTPFNTVLWRVIVMDKDQYWEGLASLFDQEANIDFLPIPRGEWPLKNQPKTLSGLKAFSHDFLSYREEDNQLIVSDLRLGMANNLSFEFIFAERDKEGNWQVLPRPKRYPSQRDLGSLDRLWLRLKGDDSISPLLN